MPSRVPLLRRRSAVAVLLVGLLVMSALLVQAAPQQPAAEPPVESPEAAPELDPPSIALPPDTGEPAGDNQQGAAGEPRDSQRVRERIRDALQGTEGQAATTGDPILDDVIGIIRSQGSVLEGSVLDEPSGADLPPLGAPAAAMRPAAAGQPEPPSSEHAYRVAESLLRSARLLSGLPDSDGQRASLVRQLRAEAIRCLTAP